MGSRLSDLLQRIVARGYAVLPPRLGSTPVREDAVGRLPDFLCLGVQKGGTTTLQRFLEKHPSAFLPRVKELHYFTLHYSQGESWYREQFLPASDQQLCGEITPYYVFHPEVSCRVKKLIPKVKLIVLLRDPVERALSQYFHSHRLGFETLSVEQAFAAEADRLRGAEEILKAPDGLHRNHQEHSYLARSRYEQQLPGWCELFSDEQLLVLKSEDLFRTPEVAWERVLHHLDLPLIELPQRIAPANAGRGEAAAVTAELRQSLRLELDPTYLWAESRFDIKWD